MEPSEEMDSSQGVWPSGVPPAQEIADSAQRLRYKTYPIIFRLILPIFSIPDRMCLDPHESITCGWFLSMTARRPIPCVKQKNNIYLCSYLKSTHWSLSQDTSRNGFDDADWDEL